MEFMQSQSDKSFDLAIVDPPYRIDYAAKPARSKHENMSHAIAAHKLGFDLTIIEKDPVYYEQAKKRLIEFQR